MVVFEDGLPRKSEYRRFTIRNEGQSDVAAMHEVITRRFERFLKARETDDGDGPGIDPETGKPRRFAYAPSLIVVDGGPPQVAAAKAAMDALGITDVALSGLAKRLEEVWLPDDPDPVIMPRTSEGLYLLQRIRDEAHRFAITHHRGTTQQVDDRQRARSGRADSAPPDARRCSRRSARSRSFDKPPQKRSQLCPASAPLRHNPSWKRSQPASQHRPSTPRPARSWRTVDQAVADRRRHRHDRRGTRLGSEGPRKARLLRRRQHPAQPDRGGRRHGRVVASSTGSRWSSTRGRGVLRADSSTSSSHLRERGVSARILYLEASDEVLVRRQEAARRPHPLSREEPTHGRVRPRARAAAPHPRPRRPRRRHDQSQRPPARTAHPCCVRGPHRSAACAPR